MRDAIGGRPRGRPEGPSQAARRPACKGSRPGRYAKKKKKMKHCSILAPLTRLAACGALAAVLAVPLPAAARVGDAALVSVTGQITAVDPATRTVTVRGPQGNEVPLQAGPDVRNFDRIKVGDTMRVDYYESVSIATRAKGSGVPEVRSETVATRAKEGALPQGAVGRSTTITAEISPRTAARSSCKARRAAARPSICAAPRRRKNCVPSKKGRRPGRLHGDAGAGRRRAQPLAPRTLAPRQTARLRGPFACRQALSAAAGSARRGPRPRVAPARCCRSGARRPGNRGWRWDRW